MGEGLQVARFTQGESLVPVCLCGCLAQSNRATQRTRHLKHSLDELQFRVNDIDQIDVSVPLRPNGLRVGCVEIY